MVFTIAIRITFAYRLNQQLMARLETLAGAAAPALQLDSGVLDFEQDPLINENHAIQWFDVKGNLLRAKGDTALQFAPEEFDPTQPIQEQDYPHNITGYTIPIYDQTTGTFIGYTRVTESTVELRSTLRSLDWGLGGGVIAALGLSGLGGLWLTRQAMQPIEQSFEKLRQFTSDAAHELRSPLTAIQTNAAVALKYPTGIRPSDAEKFQAIKSASKQLTTLTEDLLFLARSEKVDRQINPSQVSTLEAKEPINITEVLQQLLQLYQPQATAKQLQLKSTLTKNLKICGYKAQLTRLFSNLIDNAIRYTPSGGTVEVLSEVKLKKVKIIVKDTGIGIAPEHLDSIFERFWQAEQSRTPQNPGSGLGLAIAHNILRNHGGRITVNSELNRGSCFSVYL